MSGTVTVGFCLDDMMEVPLHVAASSVLRHLSPEMSLRVYILAPDLTESSIRKLSNTLSATGRKFELIHLQTQVTQFEGLRPFHGSFAAYYRLLLPDLVSEDRFLYMDTDTVTTLDISPLMTLNMQGKAMGFETSGKIGWALESSFFQRLGLSPAGPRFNSGVMLVDVKQWKEQDCFERILTFCRKYPEELLAADQTALNALFSTDCYLLEPKYNVPLSAAYRNYDDSLPGVNHFVGNPKPWDILGHLLHPYYPLWREHLRHTALSSLETNPYLNLRNWRRLPHLIGGLYRSLRLKSKTSKSNLHRL